MFFNLLALGLEGLCTNAGSAVSILVVAIAVFLCSIVAARFAFWGRRIHLRAFHANQQVEVRA